MTVPMTTVLLVRPRASGGLAAHVDHEQELLAAAGVDVRTSAAQIQDRPQPRADLRSVRELRREIDRYAPVSVHAHGLRAGALAALAMPRRRSRRPRPATAPDDQDARLVVTLHNRTIGSLPVRVVGAVLLRILARRADTVLAVSPDLAETATRAGAEDVRHAIIPAPQAPPAGGTDPVTDPATSPHSAAGLEVLVISRLAPQKGLDDLLAAAAILRDAPVHISIAGDGPRREELATRIRDQHLPVTLLGWRGDVPELLAGTDLVVSAALWEGQPVALQEALRAGRAIVATDAGGTRWVTGDAAQLVPAGDPAALAAGILEHIDHARRSRAEHASRTRATELPGPQDLLAQLREILVLDTPR